MSPTTTDVQQMGSSHDDDISIAWVTKKQKYEKRIAHNVL